MQASCPPPPGPVLVNNAEAAMTDGVSIPVRRRQASGCLRQDQSVEPQARRPAAVLVREDGADAAVIFSAANRRSRRSVLTAIHDRLPVVPLADPSAHLQVGGVSRSQSAADCRRASDSRATLQFPLLAAPITRGDPQAPLGSRPVEQDEGQGIAGLGHGDPCYPATSPATPLAYSATTSPNCCAGIRQYPALTNLTRNSMIRVARMEVGGVRLWPCVLVLVWCLRKHHRASKQHDDSRIEAARSPTPEGRDARLHECVVQHTG